jgi:hypothetical protein
MKSVRFTSHADEKFGILAAHGCVVTRAQVLETLNHPDQTVAGYKGRTIARGPLGPDHLLNVVFAETEAEIIVVTFYPGRRTRYEGAI